MSSRYSDKEKEYLENILMSSRYSDKEKEYLEDVHLPVLDDLLYAGVGSTVDSAPGAGR